MVTGKKVKENYYSEINVFGEGTKEYKLKTKEDFQNGYVVAFKLNDKDEAVDKTVAEAVYQDGTIEDYSKGYLELSGGSGKIKVDSSAVIYTLKNNDKVDKKISASKLKDYVGREIQYIVDKDDKMLVVATISHEDGGNGDVPVSKAVKAVNDAFGKSIVVKRNALRGIGHELYNELSDTDQAKVANKVFDGDTFDNIEEIEEALEDAIVELWEE